MYKYITILILCFITGIALATIYPFTPTKTSMVYKEVNSTAGTINFITRGNSLDTITNSDIPNTIGTITLDPSGTSNSPKTVNFFQNVFDAIKQADSANWHDDFAATGIRKLNIVDVKLNLGTTTHSFNEIQFFASADTLKKYDITPVKQHVAPNENYSFKDANGNTYLITTQLLYWPNPDTNINQPASAIVLVKKLEVLAQQATVPTIFYLHCDHGTDRTGLVATMYLLQKYNEQLIKAYDDDVNHPNNYNTSRVSQLYAYGQIQWEHAGNYATSPDPVYADGKKLNISNKHGDMQSYAEQVFPSPNPNIKWTWDYPTQLTVPGVNDYAW